MMVIDLSINTEKIHRILVQRVGGSEGGWCRYAVKDPPIPGTILHYYDDGAVALAATVLTALADAGYGRLNDRK